MIVALDSAQNKAVLGADLTEEIPKSESNDSGKSGQFTCLLCGSDLSFNPDPTDQLDYFVHDNTGDCVNGGNISLEHRLAQETICKPLYNVFPRACHPIQLDIESRIGGHSDFIVADIELSEPYPVAIEIINLNKQVSLHRRLKVLFSHDYRVMLVVVTTGEVSAERAEHHLKKITPIQIGQFDPGSLTVSLGSLITPSQIDPDTARWDLLPSYLS